MTNGKMSKITATWTAFIVGSLMVPFAPEVSRSQSTEPGSTIPELEIRGSTENRYTANRETPRREEVDTQPIQLGSDTGEGADEFDLNTQEGQRRQLSRDVPGALANIGAENANRQRRARAAAQVGIESYD